MIASAPEPESGRISAIGIAAAGKPSGAVSGASSHSSAASAPEARNIAATVRIATMKGMILTATWNPSFPPSTTAA